MIDAGSTLEELISHGAYDVFVEAGLPLAFRYANGIGYLNDIRLQPQDAKDFVDNLYLLAAGRYEERLIVRGNDEFSFSLEGVARFRVSAFRRQGSFSAVIRVIPFVLPTPEELRIPDEVMSLADLKEGLVLVTGGPGNGKTTTLACLFRRINETREAHIITLEDPIEYVQEHERSI
ncbi:MAG: Flp pilus assembly complex ATPase component TadA, partial [Lachnospiraceae bacterium]|nr:Flp pilus assembly complex ATPase component TadA [Lachnospiraceae bacterium]